MTGKSRLPFFYGWVVVTVTFVTMAIGVNVRTAFSLFFPPILSEFGWDRAVTAGAFSFEFFVSAFVSPLIGRLMDRAGPRAVVELGIGLMAAGLLLAPLTQQPWHLYVTIGVMVGCGSNCLGYYGQSLFLPNWFVQRRGLAIGIAFAGVGIGSVTLLPWVQYAIGHTGWRTACTGMGFMRTARFWWIALGYFGALYVWYAVQVHQTKYLLDIGFSPNVGVWALGLVSLLGIPGQIVLGHASDRIGREAIWAIACLGFAISFVVLIALKDAPYLWLVYVMVFAQGALGYGLTSVVGDRA